MEFSLPSSASPFVGVGLRPTRRAFLGGLLLLGAGTGLAQPVAEENQIKGSILAKLPQYLEWPAGTFANADEPIVIGILGADPFGPAFDASLRAFKVAGRPVQARRLRRVEDARGCHILYVAPSENGQLKTILASLRSQPILTAGDHVDFLLLGGALRFVRRDDRVAFLFSEPALREVRISAHPRLLQLGRDPAKPN